MSGLRRSSSSDIAPAAVVLADALADADVAEAHPAWCSATLAVFSGKIPDWMVQMPAPRSR